MEAEYGKDTGIVGETPTEIDPAVGKLAIAGERKRFVKKYPYADISKFKFEPYLDNIGMLKVRTLFIEDDGIQMYNINTDEFRKDSRMTGYLTSKKPHSNHGWDKMWIVGSGKIYWVNAIDTVDGFERFPPVMWNHYVNSFNVFVDENSYFNTSSGAGGNILPKIENIVKIDGVDVKFDHSKPYFASLCGAYIATYLCGITTAHLTPNDNTYPVITSIMNFHLYYCMRKYMHDPKRLNPYLNKLGPVSNNIPIAGVWEKKTDSYNVTYDKGLDWEKDNWIINRSPNSNPVRNVTNAPIMTVNGFLKGIKVNYEERTSVKLVSKSDYRRFVCKPLTDPPYGLTEIGLLLLGESIEAFTYAVLGAQAATRSPITGSYGKSSATQVKFGALVEDCVIQADPVVTLSNMRIAIRDTNVVLNTAVTPGTVLIPSSLVILSNPIPGYNNILQNATKDMKRGVNTKLNFVGVKQVNPAKKQHQGSTPIHHLDTLEGNKSKALDDLHKSVSKKIVPIRVSTDDPDHSGVLAGVAIGSVVIFTILKVVL
jgi:hypothetical protein